MKKLFNLISIMIIFGVVLFANVSFAKTDEELAFEVATAVLNNSQFGSAVIGEDQIPLVAITEQGIASAVDMFSTEGKTISAKFNNKGIIEVTIDGTTYEQVIAIGSASGKAQVSDQCQYSITGSDDIWLGDTTGWLSSPAGLEKYAKDVYGKSGLLVGDNKIYYASFVGGKATIKQEERTNSFF